MKSFSELSPASENLQLISLNPDAPAPFSSQLPLPTNRHLLIGPVAIYLSGPGRTLLNLQVRRQLRRQDLEVQALSPKPGTLNPQTLSPLTSGVSDVRCAVCIILAVLLELGASGYRLTGLRLVQEQTTSVYPIGSMVVPFCGLYVGSYKVLPSRNYYGAHGYRLRLLRIPNLLEGWSLIGSLRESGKYIGL